MEIISSLSALSLSSWIITLENGFYEYSYLDLYTVVDYNATERSNIFLFAWKFV